MHYAAVTYPAPLPPRTLFLPLHCCFKCSACSMLWGKCSFWHLQPDLQEISSYPGSSSQISLSEFFILVLSLFPPSVSPSPLFRSLFNCLLRFVFISSLSLVEAQFSNWGKDYMYDSRSYVSGPFVTFLLLIYVCRKFTKKSSYEIMRKATKCNY